VDQLILFMLNLGFGNAVLVKSRNLDLIVIYIQRIFTTIIIYTILQKNT
jgi:hypothetical protein